MDHNHDAIAKVIETIEALPSRVRVCPQWLLVTVSILALIGGITGPLALWIATSQSRFDPDKHEHYQQQ